MQWNVTQDPPTEFKRAATNSTCVTTSIVMGKSKDDKISEEQLYCGTKDGMHYKVTGVPDRVIQAYKSGIIEGVIELKLPEGAYLNDAAATLEMPKSEGSFKFKEKRGNDSNGFDKGPFDRSRRSLAVTGTRTVLVVRVVASNAAASKSEATLSSTVFGNGADGTVDTSNMPNTFKTCSYGQLNFVEAADRDGRSIRIRRGMPHDDYHLISL